MDDSYSLSVLLDCFGVTGVVQCYCIDESLSKDNRNFIETVATLWCTFLWIHSEKSLIRCLNESPKLRRWFLVIYGTNCECLCEMLSIILQIKYLFCLESDIKPKIAHSKLNPYQIDNRHFQKKLQIKSPCTRAA